MIILQSSRGAGDGVDQTCGTSRAANADRPGAATRSGHPVEQEVALLHCPAEITAQGDPVDFLNRVLADVGHDQLTVQPIEGKSIRVAEAVGVNLGDLADV